MKAPHFALKDKDGRVHDLSKVHSDYVIVYFYPKDDTSGCTIEAKSFSEKLGEFSELGATVIGISGGDEHSKKHFCEKYGLKVMLVSDPDFSVAKAYGAYGEKSFMGRKSMGIFRNTYVLDKDKNIVKVFEKVSPETHIQELLDFFGSMT